MRKLVVAPDAFMKLERTIGRFNVFDVLRSSDHELRHSNMLAWLLDPTENHGFGELFLRRWMMLVLHDADRPEVIDPVMVDTKPFKQVRVVREWSRLDVLVEITLANDLQWVIGIENKVNSRQGNDQLLKYRAEVEREYPDAKRVLLFLTRHAEQPNDKEYIPTTYQTVQQALETCLGHASGELQEGPGYLIHQYNTLLKERFIDNDEAITLAKEIYKAHGTALDYLFSQRPDRTKEVTDLLKHRLIEEDKKGELVFVHATKGLLTYVPKAWDLAQNKEAGRWYSAAFEVRVQETNAVLAAQLRPSAKDQEWRKEVLSLMKQEKFPSDNKTSAPEQWFTFYRQSLDKSLKQELSATEVADRIWKKFQEERKSAMYRKVVDVMIPLIKKLPTT
ncbi:MAG: PD-(D/E)XK nuclease family protein [Flavobacteriales bacterium]|nr:PD-(D/E)XK nuclease family protein [Flavobacteriales bacterium]